MPRFTPKQMTEIGRRYQAGESTCAIAASLGASAKGVNNVVHRLGVEIRSQVVTAEQEAIVVEACRNGASGPVAADAAGVSLASVFRILHAHGIALAKGPARRFTEDEEREIARRYAAGESCHGIARAIGCGAMTISRTLRRLGKEARHEGRSLTEEERRSAAEMAEQGKRLADIAGHFGVGMSQAGQVVDEAGVEMRTGRPPIHELDHGAFDVLTPECAYWIGFLFADGCVTQDRYGAPALVVGLAERDRGHVEKLRTFLRSTHAISIGKGGKATFGGPFACLRVRSWQLCETLVAHGIVKKRSRVPSVELAASSDFWRGAVDGDGWLGTGRYGRAIYPYIGLSGRIPLLETFQEFLVSRRLPRLRIHPTESGIWKVQTTGSTAGRIIETLYAGASSFLERKNVRARAIMTGNCDLFRPYVETPSCVRVLDQENI